MSDLAIMKVALRCKCGGAVGWQLTHGRTFPMRVNNTNEYVNIDVQDIFDHIKVEGRLRELQPREARREAREQ